MRFLLLFSGLFFSLVAFVQTPKADSILQVIERSENDSVRSAARLNYIAEFRHNYANVSAQVFAGITDAKELHDFDFLGHFHSAAGVMYAQIGNNDSALFHFEKSLHFRIYTKDTVGIAAAYLGMSNTYRNLGDAKLAIRYGLEAEKASLQVNDPNGLSRIYNAIGLVFKQQADYDKALQYFNRGIVQAVLTKDLIMLSGLYSNMGGVYQESENFDSARFYHRKALDLRLEINDEMGLGISYGNIGLIFKEQGDYDSAFYYTNLALEKFEKYNYNGGISMCYASLGSTWQKLDNQQKALACFKKAEQYATAGKFLPDLVTISAALSEIYDKLGNYEQAYKYLHQHVTFKDSLFNTEQSRETQKMQIEFEYKQKQFTDSLESAEREKLIAFEAEKQKQLNEEQAASFRIYVIGAIIVILLVLVVVLILVRVNKKQREFNSIIAEQKGEVEEKNKEITDSINYAKRIQQAILPPRQFVDKHLPECFIFYRPKDIVAGDFYWLEPYAGKDSNQVFVAAADCTGHGVPGAMVSVVCSNALNRTVKEFGLRDTGKILDKVRELVIETFEKSETDVKDGMDIALVSLKSLDDQSTEVQFSGANNPLWVVKKGSSEVLVFKGDSQPIGKYADLRPFSAHTIRLQKGDSVYFFTDGYQDQFGGVKGKKFKAANLQKLILSMADKSMADQRTVLKHTFHSWRGFLEQLDDVCVIGIRV